MANASIGTRFQLPALMNRLMMTSLVAASMMMVGCSQMISSNTMPTPQTDSEPSNSKTSKDSPIFSWYDTVLYNSQTQRKETVSQVAKALVNADVLFIGEYHGHPASHWLEAALQAELFRLRPHQVLSMEQFERDAQPVVNRYMDDEIGEKTFQKDSRAWPNYEGSYRALIEFAKAHWIPVMAANAPQDIVRCVGRHGEHYIKQLPKKEMAYIANAPFRTQADYEAKFTGLMSDHSHDKRTNNRYRAQLLRDNTMAESILAARKQYPNALILHTNGTFHSESFLGTVALLKARDPNLNIAVLTPEMQSNLFKTPAEDAFKKGTYVYTVAPLPTGYVDAQKRQAAMKKMFDNASQEKCYGEP